MDPDRRTEPQRASHLDDARRRLRDAALEAERETGRREETDAEAQRALVVRIARTIGGFVIVGIGIVLLVVPGPGWVMIVVGLTLLPFAWAQRTVRLIRRRIPGIPEDGRIPTHTWVVIGLLLVAATLLSVLFGAEIGRWLSGLWEQIWS